MSISNGHRVIEVCCPTTVRAEIPIIRNLPPSLEFEQSLRAFSREITPANPPARRGTRVASGEVTRRLTLEFAGVERSGLPPGAQALLKEMRSRGHELVWKTAGARSFSETHSLSGDYRHATSTGKRGPGPSPDNAADVLILISGAGGQPSPESLIQKTNNTPRVFWDLNTPATIKALETQ